MTQLKKVKHSRPTKVSYIKVMIKKVTKYPVKAVFNQKFWTFEQLLKSCLDMNFYFKVIIITVWIVNNIKSLNNNLQHLIAV